jgi:hypothetical protein
MSTEQIVVDPNVEQPQGGADGGQNGGGGESANPFFESFSSKFGVDAKDETTFYSTVEGWKSQAELAAKREAEVRDLQQRFDDKKVDYRTPFAKDVDAYAEKLIAEGVSPDEIGSRIEQFWKESRTDYRAMAEKEPLKLIEMQVRQKYSGMSLDDDTISALVEDEAKMPVAPDPDDFGGDSDPAYVKAKADHDKSMRLFKVRAKGIAEEFEKSKPKVDFHPVGMMTKEQIDARVAEQSKSFADSFVKFRDGFKGLQVGDSTLDMKLFDDSGQPTAEFAPVFEVIDKNVFKYLDGFYLQDGETPDAGRIAQVMLLEKSLPALLAKEYERAKSDAIKEYEARLKGNGSGFGGAGGGIEGSGPVTDPEAVAKLWANRVRT